MAKRRASVIMPTGKAIMPASKETATPSGLDANLAKAQKRVEESRRKTLEKHAPRKKKTNWKKIFFWIAIIILLAWLWKLFDLPGLFLYLMQQNPTVWAYYQAISSEVEARSLLGLLYASFFGSLFFISLPVEVIFLYYLGLQYYVVQIITIVLFGNMVGMIINYGIGRLIGEKVVRFFMKKNYDPFRKKLDRAGAFLILIGNILPFPIEPFSVFLGAVRYRFSLFLLYTLIGKVIKFVLLALGYTYFIKYASPYLGTISVEWFIEGIRNIFVFW